MKTSRLLLIAVGLSLSYVAGYASPTAFSPNEDYTAEIRELRVQQRDALRQAFDGVKDSLGVGAGSVETLFQIQNELSEVELSLAETDEQRIAILEERVGVAQELYDLFEDRERAGVVGMVETAQVKAILLAAKVALLEEKQAQENAPRSNEVEGQTSQASTQQERTDRNTPLRLVPSQVWY